MSLKNWMTAGVLAAAVAFVPSPPAAAAPGQPASALPPSRGYWLAAADGGLFTFGGAGFAGSAAALRLRATVVGMASHPSGRGYWLATSDGGIFTFGTAPFAGSAGAVPLRKPIVGVASHPSGSGYWLVASDGGVFAFGTAPFAGSAGAVVLQKPIVGMAATPSGRGYWLVASDGGVFSYGDARFRGSTGAITLNRPIVGMAATPSGNGYWLVAADGGIFAFGDAPFAGSTGAIRLSSSIVSMAASPRGLGYWLVAADGGVFTFGDAAFAGSTGALRLSSPVVSMAAAPVRASPEVAVFFYPWYATESRDGVWRHWEANGHLPPDDLASNFVPSRGAYSSGDPAIADAQLADLAAAGVDTVAVSWWGRGSYEDGVLPIVLGAAARHGVRVAALVEPYVGRTAATVDGDLIHLRGLGITDFYLYEADTIPASAWAGSVRARHGSAVRLFGENGNLTAVRSGAFGDFARDAGFDGIFTYDPVRYTSADFANVCGGARQRLLLCAPSVAPGYVASRTKPADARVVARAGGARYDSQWVAALDAGPDLVTVTSYNEWHEGTQLEPARPGCYPDGYCSPGYDGAYGVFGAGAERVYLDRTRHWVDRYRALFGG